MNPNHQLNSSDPNRGKAHADGNRTPGPSSQYNAQLFSVPYSHPHQYHYHYPLTHYYHQCSSYYPGHHHSYHSYPPSHRNPPSTAASAQVVTKEKNALVSKFPFTKNRGRENNVHVAQLMEPPIKKFRNDYKLDRSCQPRGSIDEAFAELCSRHGGYLPTNEKSILPNGTRKPTVVDNGTMKVHRYHCRGVGDDGKKCNWLGQIREYHPVYGQPYYEVYVHESLNRHCHIALENPTDSLKIIGLEPQLLAILSAILRVDEGKASIMMCRPRQLLSEMVIYARKNNRELAHKLKDRHYLEKVTDQLRGYLFRKKEAYIKARLGVSSIPNNAVLSRVLDIFKLTVPASYCPNANFRSAADIALSLGAEEDQPFIWNLTLGNVYLRYKRKAVKQTPAAIAKFQTNMEQAFMVMSPTGMFQLLCLAKRQSGTRQLNADGIGGLCSNGSSMLTFIVPALKLIRDTKPDMRITGRIVSYLHVGAERKDIVSIGLCTLRGICKELFGVPLILDWGTSDHADAFHSSFRLYKEKPFLCDDEDNHGSVQNALPNFIASNNIVTQLSHDEEQHSQVFLENRFRPESTLNCYFHVMQPFSKNTSYVKAFRNKAFVDTKKGGLAYKQVQMIHFCKTTEQRNTVMRLVLEHWETIWHENRAARIFREQYCSYPYWNWNYAVTGETGLVPINNCTESLNRVIHDNTRKNVALPRLLVETIPVLLQQDSTLRSDAATIDIPTDCSSLALTVTGFIKEGIGIVGLGVEDEVDSFLCNLRYMIGVPITEDRLRMIGLASECCSGVEDQFKIDNNSQLNLPGLIAKRIVDVTKTTCYVSRNKDGKWIGDCENCFKKGGRDCPGVTWVRNKYGILDCTLEDLRKVPANKHGDPLICTKRGNYSCSYERGLSSSTKKKPRQIYPMANDFVAYLESLDVPDLAATVCYLCLMPFKEDTVIDERFVKKQKKSILMALLKDFLDNPIRIREASSKAKNVMVNDNSF